MYVKLLLGRQKRRIEANTALSAAGLLFAGAVAQVGNGQLFSPTDSTSSTSLIVQLCWTISLVGSIFSALLAAAAAYWHNSTWSKSRSISRSVSRSDGRTSRSAIILNIFYVYGPLGMLLLSIVTFFAGLCASPYHLNFDLSVKITTFIVAIVSTVSFALLIWMTLEDELVRPAGLIYGALRRENQSDA